jgi:hypothetical protein
MNRKYTHPEGGKVWGSDPNCKPKVHRYTKGNFPMYMYVFLQVHEFVGRQIYGYVFRY